MARPKPKTSVPQRANHDSPTRWKEGQSGNPAGRFKLPEWYKQLGPQALAMQAAAGLGVVLEDIEGDTPAALQARKEMARACPANIRDATSNRIVERLYGPIKQEVKVDDTGMSPAVLALLELARGHKPAEVKVFDDDDDKERD